MGSYNDSFKADAVKKMLSGTQSVLELAKTLGVSDKTLYNWKNKHLNKHATMPNKKHKNAAFTAEQKLAAIIETASLNQLQLSEYCRVKGIYPEQLKQWKESALMGCSNSKPEESISADEAKANKKRIHALESELNRKEKALAETAALLVLAKKYQTIWGIKEDD